MILLAIDILLTVYVLAVYNEYIYYGIYVILTLIIAIINNAGLNRTKEALCNALIPLMLIAFLYVCYSLFLPTLYNVYLNNLSSMSSIFLVVYAYPFFDLLFYGLTLFLGTKVELSVKSFFANIHFLMIGYGVGMILIIGYTEVEFYYLIGYFIFKNIFVNWIVRNWEQVVSNPPCLPGWGILYYVSYGLSFIPIIGVGKLVIAKSFMSYIFAKTSTILYTYSNPLYPSNTFSATSLTFNSSLNGNIYWLSGVIIWVAMTFTQRYDRKKPNLYDFFYALCGIHLFYMGIASSLSLYVLASFANLK